MQGEQLSRLGDELGLDVVGAAPVAPYEETERHILERRARGLFADMRFTMARPEVSCHPETLLEGARTVVSAALCYWLEGQEPPPGDGRLPRYTVGQRPLRGELARAAATQLGARGSAASTACSSTRTSTSTARRPRAPASASTARTRC